MQPLCRYYIRGAPELLFCMFRFKAQRTKGTDHSYLYSDSSESSSVPNLYRMRYCSLGKMQRLRRFFFVKLALNICTEKAIASFTSTILSQSTRRFASSVTTRLQLINVSNAVIFFARFVSQNCTNAGVKADTNSTF